MQVRWIGRSGARGGVRVLVVAAVATLLVLGVSIGVLMNSYQRNQPEYRRKALVISDYGLQQALERLQREPSWSGNIPRTEYGDGWFRITVEPHDSVDLRFLVVTSEGGVGNQLRRQVCVLQLVVSDQDSLWEQRELRQE